MQEVEGIRDSQEVWEDEGWDGEERTMKIYGKFGRFGAMT